MDVQSLQRLTAAASGTLEPDAVLVGGKIVNVFTKEIMQGDIAVYEGRIAGIGRYDCSNRHDITGLYVLPGLIDAHVHIESSLASPEQFASAVIPKGTVSVIADPHEICNVAGAAGFSYMLEAAGRTPLKIHMMLPSCVPATGFETSGAELNAEKLAGLIQQSGVLGMGEMMAYPQVVKGDAAVLQKIVLALREGKIIDGHCPGLEGLDLNAYAAAGISTDHECSTPRELRDRIARGMFVHLREGSAARDLQNLLPGVDEALSRWCMFCTDDRLPEDILLHGHIDNHLRIAASFGIDPVTAVQMATINTAQCYHLKGQGAVAPGYHADMVIVDSLDAFRVREVYIDGILRAEGGKMIDDIPVGIPTGIGNTMNLDAVNPLMLDLKLSGDSAHVIHLQPGSLVTKLVTRKVERDSRGCFCYSKGSGICKIAVFERHKRTGNIGIALLENYQISGGAVALSIAHDSHNIIAAGDNDRDIVLAVNRVIESGGGIVLCAGEKVVESLALPIAGLMSDLPIEQIREKISKLEVAARNVLCINPDIDPIMTLSFLALPVIPEVKITDRGLFDVRSFTHIPV